MGYTPGLWWAEGHYIAARVPGGRPHGEIIATFGPTADSPRGEIPDEANARIAAAAPEMLRACKMALTDLEPYEWIDLVDVEESSGYAVKATVDKLRAAISKAERGDT